MERIIAGIFQSKDDADNAGSAVAQYMDASDICIFYNSPSAQQEASKPKGDIRDDDGTKEAGTTAGVSTVAGGLVGGAIGSLGGPAIAIAGAGLGAYAGSLIGALNGLGNHDDPVTSGHRGSGIILAVRIDNLSNEERVIATMRNHDAQDIEQASGEWRDGDWTDFNPLSVPIAIGDTLH